jgi:hypothetical protein
MPTKTVSLTNGSVIWLSGVKNTSNYIEALIRNRQQRIQEAFVCIVDEGINAKVLEACIEFLSAWTHRIMTQDAIVCALRGAARMTDLDRQYGLSSADWQSFIQKVQETQHLACALMVLSEEMAWHNDTVNQSIRQFDPPETTQTANA